MKNKIISSILKTIVIVSVIAGVILSSLAHGEFMTGSQVFMYFTIQSNIAIALTALAGCILMWLNIKNRVWQVIKLVMTVSITLTGVVFCVVLAPTLGAGAWAIQNVLTHVIVPIAAIADLFILTNKSELKTTHAFFVIIPPLMYAIYAGIGFSLNWNFGGGANYPYFFLNWGSPAGAFGFTNSLPFMGCMYWILLLLGFLIGLGLLYVKLVNLISKKIEK